MFATIPPATRALLYAVAGGYLVQIVADDALVRWFALWPLGSASAATHGGPVGFLPWQLVSYSFLHGSPLHLLFNAFGLYLFGSDLERVLGRRRFLACYFVSVAAAGIAQLFTSALAGGPAYPTIGASGGVFGVLLAFAVYFPRRVIVLIFPPLPLPARTFVVLYAAIELYLGVTGTQAGVAHFAHLGGMAGSFLLIRGWRRRRFDGA